MLLWRRVKNCAYRCVKPGSHGTFGALSLGHFCDAWTSTERRRNVLEYELDSMFADVPAFATWASVRKRTIIPTSTRAQNRSSGIQRFGGSAKRPVRCSEMLVESCFEMLVVSRWWQKCKKPIRLQRSGRFIHLTCTCPKTWLCGAVTQSRTSLTGPLASLAYGLRACVHCLVLPWRRANRVTLVLVFSHLMQAIKEKYSFI